VSKGPKSGVGVCHDSPVNPTHAQSTAASGQRERGETVEGKKKKHYLLSLLTLSMDQLLIDKSRTVVNIQRRVDFGSTLNCTF
jgi:hypothetical protein